jgi:DNA polymerase eta
MGEEGASLTQQDQYDEAQEMEIRSTAEDSLPTWHDVALSIAAEMMQRARDEVRTKLGYSTSAVSHSSAASFDSS